MSKNMPVLWQNAIEQYSTEIAKKAWIWFADTHGDGMQYEADKYAEEVERLVLSISPIVHSKLDDEKSSDLLSFILKRHANHRLGGNVNPSYIA